MLITGNTLINDTLKSSQEKRSAYSAFTFGLLALAASLFLYRQDHFTSPHHEFIGISLPLGYLASIGLFYLFIQTFPALFKSARKIVLILTHVSFLTAAIYNADEYGIVAIPLYLWVIIANGARFGMFYMLVSLISSLVALAFLVIMHPFWAKNLLIVIAILLSVLLVSFSYISLVRSLYKTNQILDNNLKEMSYKAKHDELTSLPNRAYFRNTLLQRIKDKDTRLGSISLLFIDLDNFKLVNDRFGHQMGDDVIQEAANRLLHICNEPHFSARLGGDEFVVIFDHSEPIESKLDEIILELGKPYFEKIDFITVSIGVSTYVSKGFKDEEVMFNLQKKADLAMYESKQNGKNTFHFSDQL